MIRSGINHSKLYGNVNMFHTAFDNYANKIRRLRSQSLANGMTSEQFERVYHTALENFRKESPRSTQTNPDPPKRILFTKQRCLIFSLLLVAVVAYNIKTIHSNLQEYIYPALQLLRNLSIPIVAVFPSLTELYHETCLLHNPFFTVVDMDCWPCSSTTLTNVQEIDEPNMQQMNNNQLNNAPFIYKTDQKSMDFNTLQNLYLSNYNMFDLESSKVLTNNKYHITPKKMFEEQGEKNLHIWKFNTMNTARILRQVIPRPKVVPKFGQSTERFIIVDQRHESFKIPDTECNFSFLLVLAGSRTIELNPAEECKHQCKSLKIDLKETYLLWYNWWYWKPLVQQSGNETFIAQVGSYC